MALTKEQIATDYPLPVYNYRVNIADETIAFSEVSGLDIGKCDGLVGDIDSVVVYWQRVVRCNLLFG